LIYKVKEIFKSIQGEGYHVGRNAVFVRFSGCNLWNGNIHSRKNAICNFCDTDFVGTDGLNGGKYSLDQLAKKINMVWDSTFSKEKKFVIFTGGEPLLQVNQSLVNELKSLNFYVALETNGTLCTNIKFDWVCVSPKENSIWKLKNGDELKVVYPQNKFNLKNLEKLDFKFFFLQPKYDALKRVNLVKTLDYCKLNENWFPSFQIHKVLRIS